MIASLTASRANWIDDYVVGTSSISAMKQQGRIKLGNSEFMRQGGYAGWELPQQPSLPSRMSHVSSHHSGRATWAHFVACRIGLHGTGKGLEEGSPVHTATYALQKTASWCITHRSLCAGGE